MLKKAESRLVVNGPLALCNRCVQLTPRYLSFASLRQYKPPIHSASMAFTSAEPVSLLFSLLSCSYRKQMAAFLT